MIDEREEFKDLIDDDSEYFNSNEPMGIDERADSETEDELLELIEKEENKEKRK